MRAEHRLDRELRIEQVNAETIAAEMPISNEGIGTDPNSAKRRAQNKGSGWS